MARSKKRNVFRKSLQLEQLQAREVFAGDLVVDPIMITPNTQTGLDWFARNKMYSTVTPTDKLNTFANQAELDSKLKQLVGQYWEGVLGKKPDEIPASPVLYNWGFNFADDVARVRPLSLTSSTFEALSITNTNTRHAEIDEADRTDLTTDGYLYYISAGALQVIDLRDPQQVETHVALSLTNNFFTRLMVAGDQLLVIENVFEPYDFALSTNNTHIKVSLYDISDRLSPVFKSETTVDGNNLAVNLIDGTLTLVQGLTVELPKPELVKDADGVERYQSLDAYFTAHSQGILAALLPDYSSGENLLGDVGDWQDLAIANDSLTQSTTVLHLSTKSGTLTLGDSETIVGVSANLVYQGLEDIYLVSQAGIIDNQSQTFIYKIDNSSQGDLEAVGVSGIIGNVNSTAWMNESNGVLQVASLGRKWSMELLWTNQVSANITTIGDVGAGWRVLGTLEDFADGQSLLSANFVGDRVIVTTGATPEATPLPFDPLHGIDLSDPLHPVEFSELTIPGFTTYMMQVDSTHWLGLGYDNPSGAWNGSVLQVSLYEVADLANPRVLDRWTSTGTGWFGTIDPHSVTFDPSTGLLTLASNLWNDNGTGMTPVPLLQIDVSAADPLLELGTPKLTESISKSLTIGNIFVAVTDHAVVTFDVADMSTPLDMAYLPVYGDLNNLYNSQAAGTTIQWDIKSQWHGEPFTILKVESDGAISATLSDDQTLTLTAPDAQGYIGSVIALTVQFESGHTETFHVSASAYAPEPRYADGHAAIGARFTDDDGNTVTELSQGDEVWVTVSMTDLRENPSGVFGAYVDVSFDSGNITVIGEPEHLNNFSNGGMNRGINSVGIKSLGGFGGLTPTNTASSDFARFKIRVDNDQPVTMTFTAASNTLDEVLVFGASKAIDPQNVEHAVLTTADMTMRSLSTTQFNRQQDVNNDGIITALDVLTVVNYINSRDDAPAAMSLSALSANAEQSTNLDVTGDGVISALDVLQIVNTINARYNAPASGEGTSAESGSLDPVAVDQVFAIDLDTLPKTRRTN